MAGKRGELPAAVAVGVVCLVIGGVAGFYGRYWGEVEQAPASGAPAGRSERAGGPSPAGGGGAPGMGGGGGSEIGQSQIALAGMVRGLATLQAAQGKGLTPDQSGKVLPLLKQVREAAKMSDADCKAKVEALQLVLTDDQKKVLERLTRRRGGRGGAGGPGGGAGAGPGGASAPGVGPGSGPGGAGAPGGGGGAPTSPDTMFKEGQSAQYLDELLKAGK